MSAKAFRIETHPPLSILTRPDRYSREWVKTPKKTADFSIALADALDCSADHPDRFVRIMRGDKELVLFMPIA